jgi:endo-1,3-1,4-beta-glycanase ExoK
MRWLGVSIIAFSSVIASIVSAKPYKGAEIYSNQSYLYGRYEMRMRVANAGGVLSTFFTYKNGSEVGNTFWEEIDIEVFGKNNATQWQTNIILGSSRPTIHTEQVHTASGTLGDAYHTYVLEWTPDYVAWYLDGAEVRRITGTSTVTSLTNAQSLRFNIWASESVPWTGSWDDSKLPVYQFVNYIDYKAYNTTTKVFEGGWRDDFNSFDTTRWSKANWTFDTNRVDFFPDNVVVKDGILVLALTHENATGFTGAVPADDNSSSSSSSSADVSSISASSSSSEASSVQSSSESSSAISSESSSTISSSKRSGSSGGGAMGWVGLLLLSVFMLKRIFFLNFFTVFRR